MGFLRIYLALCVISSHTTGIFLGCEHRGDQAVQIFFTISGFYMGLVLTESYTSKSSFYLSRAVRIFVPYYAILICICVVSCISGLISNDWLGLNAYVNSPLKHNGATGFGLAAVSNFSIFCQDWLLFLKQDYGQPLQFAANFAHSKSMLWHYLIIPQSWSLALELCFYAVAPLLNALKTINLVVIIVAATGLRTYLYNHLGLNYDPWTYRFFPCEVSTFLIGMLGYRMYRRFRNENLPAVSGMHLWWFYAILLGGLLALAWITKEGEKLGVISYLTYFLFMIIIPVLFLFSRESKFDRSLGELSFPVYLLHYALIPLGLAIIHLAGLGDRFLGLVVATLAVGAAILTLKLLILPLENWRRQFKRPGTA